jgi:hypothetical protein
MGKFKIGDRVVDRSGGYTAKVVGVTDTIRVVWDCNGIDGTWPDDDFELLARKFKPGQYVRIVATDPEYGNEVGIIFGDDGDDEENMPYEVALYDDSQTEDDFSASELIPWLPLVGEHVIEANNESDQDEIGTVIGWANAVTARVLWESFPHAQDWLVTDLEPADESEPDCSFDDGGPYNEIRIGDEVEYTNPFFSGTHHATVEDGYYHKDFFSKAA